MARRSPYRKSEVSQKQLLEAATAVIARKGLAQSSVQDIADAAGVSKGVVHYHFESKDDLVEQTVLHACAALSERIRGEFLVEGTPIERMRRAIAELWAVRRDGVPEIRVVMEAMTAGVHDPKLARSLGAVLRTSREQIVEVGFKSLLEMGLRPRFEPEAMARLLLGALDGLAIHHLFDPMDPATEEQMLNAVERFALALFEM